MKQALVAIGLGITLGIVVDLGIAWIWLSTYDGPEFPY